MSITLRQAGTSAPFGALLSLSFFAGQVQAEGLESMGSPVTNPVNFEDPRIESNIKPIYIHHRIDDKFVTQGGSVDIYALQLRYAIDERWAIIATKDGYVQLRPDAVLPDGSGFANLGGGVKYAFFKGDDTIGTAGLRYEVPTGENEVLQGSGDGVFNPFLSAATALGPVNLIGYTGFRAPVSGDDSMFYDASVHIDSNFSGFIPLLEFNLYHVLDAGRRLPIADEGQDFFNIGSSLSEGETMLTAALGARYAFTDSTSIGAAYEIPLLEDSGTYITDWRLTTDLLFAF